MLGRRQRSKLPPDTKARPATRPPTSVPLRQQGSVTVLQSSTTRGEDLSQLLPRQTGTLVEAGRPGPVRRHCAPERLSPTTLLPAALRCAPRRAVALPLRHEAVPLPAPPRLAPSREARTSVRCSIPLPSGPACTWRCCRKACVPHDRKNRCGSSQRMGRSGYGPLRQFLYRIGREPRRPG